MASYSEILCPFCGSNNFAPDSFGITCLECGSVTTVTDALDVNVDKQPEQPEPSTRLANSWDYS